MPSDKAVERNRERSRERARRLRAEKKCLLCGRQDSRTLGGKSYCQECAEYRSIKQMDYQDRRFALGLCLQCGKPVEPERSGKKYCAECQAKRTDARREWQKRSVQKATED